MFERMIKMFGPPPIQSTQMLYPPQSFFPTGAAPSMVPSAISQGGQGAGFLSKLFSGIGGGSSSALGSATSTLTSGQGMNIGQMIGMVQNAQKVIQTIQTVGPIVQQYGPFVKALPQMMKILSNNSTNDNQDTEQEEEQDAKQDTTKNQPVETTKKSTSNKQPKVSSTKKKKISHPPKKNTQKYHNSTNIPQPKLYI